MNQRSIVAACAALAIAACAGAPLQTAPPAPALRSGIDPANFDPAVRPQDNFFRYVNGTWLKNNPIPADRGHYGAGPKVFDDTQQQLRAIIEESSIRAASLPAGSDERRIGDLYNSFLDEPGIEARGLAPLAPLLQRIDAVKSRKEFPALIAELGTLGADSTLSLYISADAKDPSRYVVYLFQSELGLPDRDFYLLPDAKFASLRAAYVEHVGRMLALAGDKRAARNAKDILALETAIAKTQWTRVDSRDDDKTYNRYEVARLNALTPGFDFAACLAGLGIKSDAVIVSQPSAFTGLAAEMQRQPLPVWKAYFRWHLLRAYAPYLPKAYVDENFAFYSRTLQGVPENRPRWKRGVALVEESLGESLGKVYVARHFPPEAKARMDELVKNLIAAYGESIRTLDWMSETTKAQALVKLAKFTPKIGYPDQWRDYSSLEIAADDLVGNRMRWARFETRYQTGKLGKPVDRGEWLMTPQTVNAYYNPTLNEIVFPAAILQPPFFDLGAEDAVNYGGIGSVIGHEIGHGFDDQGSKYTGDGVLQSWWTAEDRAKFEARTKALIAQYDAYEPVPGHKVNGALTIGENIGDLGGASIAYKAYRLSLRGRPAPVIDGLSGDQRFFMGYAQVWRGAMRDARMIEFLKTDPHSPREYRVIGPLVNVPEFYAAFGVKEGDQMYLPPEKRVKIW